MTLVEKVARALCAYEAYDTDRFWVRFEGPARAAIEAMREPTDGMYAAYRCDELWRDLTSVKVWQLWITAALNEVSPSPNADLIARLRAVANDLITGKNVASAAMLCTEAADVLEKQK